MAAPHLDKPESPRAGFRVIRDEDAPSYDGQAQERTVPFVMTDKEAGRIIKATLGPSHFTIYWDLCSRLTDGVCWPSLDTLADENMISRRHIARVLKDLEDGQWISRTQRKNDYGMVTSTEYRIAHIPGRMVKKADNSGSDMTRTQPGHGVDMGVLPMSLNKEENKNLTRTEQEEDVPPFVPPGEKPKAKPEPKPKSVKVSIPDGFAVTDEMRSAAKRRYQLSDQQIDAKTERFVSWAKAKGQRYIDWPAGWLNFMEPKAWDREPQAAPGSGLAIVGGEVRTGGAAKGGMTPAEIREYGRRRAAQEAGGQ